MSSGTNASDSPENTHFSWEELLACVEEGARRKVPVMAHAHGADGITLAALAGETSFITKLIVPFLNHTYLLRMSIC